MHDSSLTKHGQSLGYIRKHKRQNSKSKKSESMWKTASRKDPGSRLHRWFPLVRIALLGYNTLYAKIGFSMGKVTLEFCTICNKVFYLVGTKAYMSLHHEF